MTVHDIKIQIKSDWSVIEILGDGHWHIGEDHTLKMCGDSAPGLNFAVGVCKLVVNKRPHDKTPVELSVPLYTDQDHIKLRICKGDIEYVEVTSGQSILRNDTDQPQDPLNCIEGVLRFDKSHQKWHRSVPFSTEQPEHSI